MLHNKCYSSYVFVNKFVFPKDYHGAAGTVWDGTGEFSLPQAEKFWAPVVNGTDPIVSFSAPVVTGWDGTICV